MKKVFVTGGAGFIASHVIDRLLLQEVEVVTNVRTHYYHDHLDRDGLEVYQGDIRDKTLMYALVEKCDGVIHLAGLLGTRNVDDAWLYYDTNVQGALNLLDSCTSLEVPMVGIAVGNWFETNNYSNSKYAAEREMLKYARYKGTHVNVVRGLNAYGIRQKVIGTGKIIPTFITQALEGRTLNVYGGKEQCGMMDMIHVEDLAQIFYEVLLDTSKGKHGFGNVYEAGTGEALSVWDVANTIVKEANSDSEVVEVPMRKGESNRSFVVAEKPYPFPYKQFNESISPIIEWYRERL